jgi:hypothetical protein
LPLVATWKLAFGGGAAAEATEARDHPRANASIEVAWHIVNGKLLPSWPHISIATFKSASTFRHGEPGAISI